MLNDLGVCELNNQLLDDIVRLPSGPHMNLQQAFREHAKCNDDEQQFEDRYKSFLFSMKIEYGIDWTWEGAIWDLCSGWLKIINKHEQTPRSYVQYVIQSEEIPPLLVLTNFRQEELKTLFLKSNTPAKEAWEIRCTTVHYAYPRTEAGLSEGFPIAAIQEDATDRYQQEFDGKYVERWQDYRKKTYKQAEHFGILLTMAQKQLRAYDSSAFRAINPRDKLEKKVFEVSGYAGPHHLYQDLHCHPQPFLIALKGDHLTILTAKVSRAYLKALDNATSPKLPENVTVPLMCSRKYNMRKQEDVVQVFCALVGFVDTYDKLITDLLVRDPEYAIHKSGSARVDDGDESSLEDEDVSGAESEKSILSTPANLSPRICRTPLVKSPRAPIRKQIF